MKPVYHIGTHSRSGFVPYSLITEHLIFCLGNVRSLAPSLFDLINLTHLYVNDNSLTKLPPDIGRLSNLQVLDASNNKLRTLPPEIGDLRRLKELLLNNNYLRNFPFEMGKLFKLQILGIKGNPLPADMMNLQAEVNGTSKLLTFLLDNLPGTSVSFYFAIVTFQMSCFYFSLNSD